MDLRRWIVCGATALVLAGAACGTDSQDPRALWETYDDRFVSYLETANAGAGREIVRWSEIAPGLIPRRVQIEGTHYELGQWIGRIAMRAGRSPRGRSSADADINRRIEAMYEVVSPGHLDLARGVAAAFGTTLDQLDLRHLEHGFFNDLWWELFAYSSFTSHGFPSGAGDPWENCSLVSSWLELERSHWVGRNFDNPSDRPHFVATSRLDGVHDVLGNTCYCLYHWMTDGMNEHGLFLGVATNGYPPEYNQAEPDYPDEPAVQVIHMVRIALESCSTTEEAIDLFGSVRIWFPVEVNHILVADAHGSAAVLEFDQDRRLVVFRRDTPYLVLTNAAYLEGDESLRSICSRYRRATDELAQGGQDHDTFLRAVDSIRVLQGQSRTLWAAYFDLSGRQMEVRFRSDGFDIPHAFALP